MSRPHPFCPLRTFQRELRGYLGERQRQSTIPPPAGARHASPLAEVVATSERRQWDPRTLGHCPWRPSVPAGGVPAPRGPLTSGFPGPIHGDLDGSVVSGDLWRVCEDGDRQCEALSCGQKSRRMSGGRHAPAAGLPANVPRPRTPRCMASAPPWLSPPALEWGFA